MMNDKERYEYAEELIRVADEAGGIPDPQVLIDTMAKMGVPHEVDDQVAILNLVSEILHNREQEDDAAEDITEEAIDEVQAEEATA